MFAIASPGPPLTPTRFGMARIPSSPMATTRPFISNRTCEPSRAK